MLLESRTRQTDDLPKNTRNKITLNKNNYIIRINNTFNGPPGVCKQ